MRVIVVGNLCACRCGGEVKPGNRFLHGHNGNRRGTTHICSPETKMQVSNALIGHNVSIETREKIRLGHIDKVGWKRGKTKETDARVLKQSQTMRARSPQKEEIEKICECGKCGKVVKTQGSRFLRGHSNAARDKIHYTQEIKDKHGISSVRRYHPDWTQEEIEEYLAHRDDLNNFCQCTCGQKCKGKFINGHDRRGKSSWNKGLTKETNASVARTAEKQKGRIRSAGQIEKQRIAATGKKRSQETKDKVSAALKGVPKSTSHVTNVMKNSGLRRLPYTKTDGVVIKMRSNWEIVYAKYLDSLNITWTYESKSFTLGDGHRYFPDFYLPEINEYHEVKGWMSPRSIEKIGLFRKDYPNEKLILIEELEFYSTNNICISFKKDGVRHEA